LQESTRRTLRAASNVLSFSEGSHRRNAQSSQKGKHAVFEALFGVLLITVIVMFGLGIVAALTLGD
jgi:hypothetical protein